MAASTSSTITAKKIDPKYKPSNGESDLVSSSSLITDKMLKEEQALEEKLESAEQSMRSKIAQEEKQMEEENCYKRLKLLLSRSSIYVKFMAEKLEKHEAMKKKREERKQKQEGKGSKKRKDDQPPVKKKPKTDVHIMDVYKRENMQEVKEDENLVPNANAASDVDISELQPSLLTGGVMRKYQFDGFEWMKALFENGVNGILADEMGLGKTIQCIAFIAHLIEMGVSGPFFVCGPLSTVPNWYAEFQRFTPQIPLVFYHGDKKEREELRKDIKKLKKVGDGACYPVVITSYAIALNDTTFLKNIQWKMLAIDEAHRIKNFQCKLVEALKMYKASHRLLLTGTPLQNNLVELWSLLNFILPEIFDDLKVFQSWFDISRLTQVGVAKEIIAKESEMQIVSTIHQILAPFLLRRTKADVKLDIPNKKEVIVECPLSDLQHKYYTWAIKGTIEAIMYKTNKDNIIIDRKRVSKPARFFGVDNDQKQFIDDYIKEELSKNGKENNKATPSDNDYINKRLSKTSKEDSSSDDDYISKKLSISGKENNLKPSTSDEDITVFSDLHLNTRNITMCLRRICCHPYMISYPVDFCGEYLVDENTILNSGKMRVLDLLLTELKKRGHKVLIFSQFVSMIEILQDYCYYRGHKYTRLIGETRLSDRQEEIKQFNEDPSTFIFLISTKAGGLGINLVAADTVVIYDSDWNPMGDLQAQDRCHRIGQTKPVVVYRLLIPNTVDWKVYDYSYAKRKLEKVIIQKGRFASNSIAAKQWQVTEEELLEMLEQNEENGVFKTDKDSVLSKEELERLLDRSDIMGQCGY